MEEKEKMEEKENKKYINYEATLDGIGTFESPVLEGSFIEKIRVDIVEKTDYMILQAINTIGGKRYRHITVDKNKVLDALSKATAKAVSIEAFGKGTLKKCPTCGKWLRITSILPEKMDEYSYCSKCGQKLDWSEVMP